MTRQFFTVCAAAAAMIAAALIVLCSPAYGQATQPVLVQPDCTFNVSITATGRYPANTNSGFDNRLKGCVVWIVAYQSTGFSALSLRFDSAADSSAVPGTWGAYTGTIVDGNAAGAATGPGVNPNTDTNWAFVMLKGPAAWVSLNLMSKTGSGTIYATVFGWRPRGIGDTASSIPPSGPCGGDLSGTFPNCTVAKINTVPLGSTTATAAHILVASGTQWVSVALSGDCSITSAGVITCGSSSFWQRSSGAISPTTATDTVAPGVVACGSLPPSADGAQVRCTGCTVTSSIDSTCSCSGGLTAFATRLNSAWKCSL